MPNVYLRTVAASRVQKVELDEMEAEVLVVPPEEPASALTERSPDEKEKEAKRLRLLKWLAPSKGVARDRLEHAEQAARSEEARARATVRATGVMSLGNDFHVRPLQEFLKTCGLGDAIGGGREVGADIGHGRPTLLRPDAVAKLADALAAVERPSESRLEGELLFLIGFYRDAADGGEAILHYRL